MADFRVAKANARISLRGVPSISSENNREDKKTHLGTRNNNLDTCTVTFTVRQGKIYSFGPRDLKE